MARPPGDDDEEEDDLEIRRICACGCSDAEHVAVGRCVFCEACDGFTYDPEATLLAAIFDD